MRFVVCCKLLFQGGNDIIVTDQNVLLIFNQVGISYKTFGSYNVDTANADMCH